MSSEYKTDQTNTPKQWKGPPDARSEKGAGTYPNYHSQKTRSGHVFTMDDSDGAESVTLQHRSGSMVQFLPDGAVQFVSHNGQYTFVFGENRVQITGAYDVTVLGAASLNVTKDYNMTVQGNHNTTVNGDMNITAKNMNTVIRGNMDTSATNMPIKIAVFYCDYHCGCYPYYIRRRFINVFVFCTRFYSWSGRCWYWHNR